MIHDVSLRSVSNSSSECLSERCSRYHHWETKQTTLLRSMSNKVPSSEVTKWILRSSHDSFVHFCDHSAGKTKAKHMENGLIFHVTIQIQILTMFSVQSKYSKKTKSISLLGFVISNKTCKTRNVQIRCQPSRLSSPSRWKPNSLLPMQKRSNGFISPQMSHNFHTRAQTKTPTKRICQGTQRTYLCVTLKNMPKLIIHHDILWNIEIEALCMLRWHRKTCKWSRAYENCLSQRPLICTCA